MFCEEARTLGGCDHRPLDDDGRKRCRPWQHRPSPVTIGQSDSVAVRVAHVCFYPEVLVLGAKIDGRTGI